MSAAEIVEGEEYGDQFVVKDRSRVEMQVIGGRG